MALQPPDPDEPKKLPDFDFDFDIIEPVAPPKVAVRNRSARDAMISFIEPAVGSFTAKGRVELAQVSMDNGLVTPRPPKLLVTFSRDKSKLVMMPTNSSDPRGLTVSYGRRKVTINLYAYFAEIDRFVPTDRRESFPIYRTPAPVTLGDVKGYALYIKLKEFISEPINRLSEEEKARRQARRQRKDTAAGEESETTE